MKENFSKGLNTIDSPYTIQDGETRDCLNVVSTERGSIRKRFGSVAFASGVSGTFPNLAATDNFNRANENPLSNAGKWEGWLGSNPGEVFSNQWKRNAIFPKSNAARWTVGEQANPAVAIEVAECKTIELFACMSALEHKGYALVVTRTGTPELKLYRYNGEAGSTLLASVGRTIENGDSIGIAVREGIVSAWVKHGGTWSKVLEVADATYTTGYAGFGAPSGQTCLLDNFALGEMPAPSTSVPELTGLASVSVAGTTYLVAAGGTELFSVNPGGEISSIGSGFTSGLRWSVVQAPVGTKKTGGPIYLSNGKDKPQYWSGAAKNTPVAAWVGEAGETFYEDAASKEHVPNGKYSIFAGNRIWMAGMSDDPSAVRFSGTAAIGEGGEQSDPTAWPKENVVRFDASDGNPITGVGTVGPYVLVFKQNKTWVIHNLDTGENRKLADTVGCISHRSIVETSLGTFFLTLDQGVYLTNGSTLREMSYNVRPTILGINPAQREFAAGAYFNNHYYLSFASGTSSVNNRTLDYDVTLKSWWLHDLAGNQWAIWEPTSGQPHLFTAPPKVKAGIVQAFVPGVYTDSGVNYAGNGFLGAWWISPWEPFAYYIFRHRIKAPFLKKRLRQIFFNGSGEIIPLVYKDFSPGGTQQPAVINNAPMAFPTFPADFSQNEPQFGNSDTSQLFGGELYNGVQMLFGGSRETSAARLYALGAAFVWGVGFGNNSSRPFEVDAYMMAVQFRKS